jgi:hypothetical protein
MLIQAPEALKQKSASVIFSPGALRGGSNKIKGSILHACHGFSIKASEEFDLAVGQPDYLITEPTSLEHILTEQAGSQSHMPPLTVICITMDPQEKTALEARISKSISALGWIVEIIMQP